VSGKIIIGNGEKSWDQEWDIGSGSALGLGINNMLRQAMKLRDT
jgi:hypothetical protein